LLDPPAPERPVKEQAQAQAQGAGAGRRRRAQAQVQVQVQVQVTAALAPAPEQPVSAANKSGGGAKRAKSGEQRAATRRAAYLRAL
ncbi:MAG: hypothetical protein OXH78_13660, partial [Acidimicrobiaceae bacterium]|nr:hypothetical protein [Acidimicrobiaceae bacterium]